MQKQIDPGDIFESISCSPTPWAKTRKPKLSNQIHIRYTLISMKDLGDSIQTPKTKPYIVQGIPYTLHTIQPLESFFESIQTLKTKPYTLNGIPYTLHTMQPVESLFEGIWPLNPQIYTLNPTCTPCLLHSTSNLGSRFEGIQILNNKPQTINLKPYTLQPTPHTLHPILDANPGHLCKGVRPLNSQLWT